MGLVGVAVAIALAVLYGSFGLNEAKPSTKQLEGFSLDDVLFGKFYAESFNGTWISGFAPSQYRISVLHIYQFVAQIMNSSIEPLNTASIFTT